MPHSVRTLPADHALSTLDLSEETRALGKDELLVVRNEGKTIALTGSRLAVQGNASIETTPYELAGIDGEKLVADRNITIDPARAPAPDTLQSTELKGRVFRFGGDKSITALDDRELSGCVHCLDADGNRLLTIDGDTGGVDMGRARQRIEHMQLGVKLSLLEALAGNDQDALAKLGVPEEVRARLTPGEYTIDGVSLDAAQREQTKNTWNAREAVEEDASKASEKKRRTIPALAPEHGQSTAAAPDEDQPISQKEVDYALETNTLGLSNPALESAIRLRRHLAMAEAGDGQPQHGLAPGKTPPGPREMGA